MRTAKKPAPATEWNFSCPDWEARLRAGRSLVPTLPINKAEAARAVQIFNRLRLPDVPDQPRLQEAAGQWQRDIVGTVFGSLVDGVRKVPEVFVMVPKKNSKTTGGAAITLTAKLMNRRPRAEFIFVGPTQEVADLAFQQTVGMIEADEDGVLQKRFQISEHIKTIFDRKTRSKLKIKTFDMKVMTGSKPVFVLIDELHIMSEMANAGRIMTQIRGGLVTNPEAILIIITTQSDEPPAGVFKSELQYARGVRDGRIKEGVRMLPVLYEFPEAMQTDEARPWQDAKNWPMVLPNLNRSITVDRLWGEYLSAKERGEEDERRWASQHLNVEIGLALHNDRWRGADYWLRAGDSSLTLDEILRRSDVVTVGIDAGGLDDMMGLAVMGREDKTETRFLWTHGWVQRAVLALRKDISEKLEDFAKDGDLMICEQPTEDVNGLCAIVERVFKSGLLPEKLGIGLDPYGIGTIIEKLATLGIAGDILSAIRQGAALSPASWGMERKLSDGTLRHNNSRFMAWVVGNAKVEQRGNANLITKQVSGRAKIDPLVASFNAYMLMDRNPVAKRAPQFQVAIY